jgi:hypothetical protein
MEAMTKPIPMAVPIKTKIAPPVPPFVRGMASVLYRSQSGLKCTVTEHYSR